ncbi:DoxX protein [Flavobacterium sp. 3HN19-14]|uniref:DoxX protein n=1 Tax=Flavobacterium sp. 3HN19-14 TaxID=3448133 RepID=UPI003EDFC5FA
MSTSFKILRIIFNLILGGMLVFGGIKKFEKPTPSPTEIIEKVKSGEEVAPSTEVLKIKNYIFGMKQTDYFWPFLGIVELLAGILLISQVASLIGAIIALPLTINIFLFHMYLEPHETSELIEMTGLLVINLLLISFGYKYWKPMLFDKTIIKFG